MQTFQSNSTGLAQKKEGKFGPGVKGRKGAKGIVRCLRNVYDCGLFARNPLDPARVNKSVAFAGLYMARYGKYYAASRVRSQRLARLVSDPRRPICS